MIYILISSAGGLCVACKEGQRAFFSRTAAKNILGGINQSDRWNLVCFDFFFFLCRIYATGKVRNRGGTGGEKLRKPLHYGKWRQIVGETENASLESL